jgi:SpoVK/Ycf46/Vps4 family AAA+-type ATPase
MNFPNKFAWPRSTTTTTTTKTLLAKAVAKLLRSQSSSTSLSSSVALPTGGAFISLSSSDIVRAQVGTGEKLVVQAFETAKMNAPAVIFIDEFQALFTERSSSNIGSGRLTSTLLSAMDGCRRWAMADRKVASLPGQGNSGMEQERRIVILAATNTPWMVDRAFLRPGRFDEVVHVDLPGLDERQSILKLQMDRMKTAFSGDAATVKRICTNLAQSTEGFSGADLVALCRSAAVKCLLCGNSHVREQDFMDSRRDDAMASSSPKLVERIKKWHT